MSYPTLTALRTDVDYWITSNHTNRITGSLMNIVLNGIIDFISGAYSASAEAVTILGQNQIGFGTALETVTGSDNWTYNGKDVQLHQGNIGIDPSQSIHFNGVTDPYWIIQKTSGSGNYVTGNAFKFIVSGGVGDGFILGTSGSVIAEITSDTKRFLFYGSDFEIQDSQNNQNEFLIISPSQGYCEIGDIEGVFNKTILTIDAVSKVANITLPNGNFIFRGDTTAPMLQIENSSGSIIGFTLPANPDGSTYILPALSRKGSLLNDGSGYLSWGTDSLAVKSFKFVINTDGTGVPSNFDAYLPAGNTITYSGLASASRIETMIVNTVPQNDFGPGATFFLTGSKIDFTAGGGFISGDSVVVFYK